MDISPTTTLCLQSWGISGHGHGGQVMASVGDPGDCVQYLGLEEWQIDSMYEADGITPRA